jgi:hypothetical protein
MLDMLVSLSGVQRFRRRDVMDGPAHAKPMNALLTAAARSLRISPRRPFDRVLAHSPNSVKQG